MTRQSFRSWIALVSCSGLQPGDSVPDAKTIWGFKQLLEKDGRDGGRKLFERFGQLLQSQGMLAKEGSIVNASKRARFASAGGTR